MAGNVFTYSSQTPLYSVTNPDAEESRILDSQSPFNFYDFLKYSQETLTSSQYNTAYQQYLVEWANVKKYNKQQSTELIGERYVELLKDISLNYLTYEERRFISLADLNDPADLDVIIPFYSRKIREICNFYTSKREKIKNRIEVVKQKGSRNSLEQAVFEALTEYIFVSDDVDLVNNVPALKVENIITTLKIEIEELYDLYSSYLDNSPKKTYSDYSVKTELRQQLYTSNINDIDADIFLNFDEAVKRYILEHLNIYLTELYKNFTINYNLDAINLDCKEGSKLYDLITTNRANATTMLNLKKQLIEKYMGSDLYYVKTGSTTSDVTSGILVEASNPMGNLLNRHYPSTASVEEESELYTIRNIGYFFRPEKNGLLYFSVPESRYKINTSKLSANQVYVFPDPNLYGNTTGLTNETDTNYPLTHITNYESSVKNAGSFFAEGDINVNPFKQSFFPYYSKNQINNNIQTNYAGLSTNLASIVDRGVCTQWTSDVYGNQYGLFKRTPKRQLVDERSETTVQLLTSYEYYDGGIISFRENVPVPDPVYADSSLWVSPNIFASNYYYNALFDGGIGYITNGIMIRPILANRVYDGLIYTLPADTTYTITLNPNNTTFSNGSLTIDGGLYTDGIIYDGDFTLFYITSAIQYHEMDGGPITRSEPNELAQSSYKYTTLMETSVDKQTELLGVDNFRPAKFGEIYVKDIVSGRVTHLSSALMDVVEKYSESIQYELINAVESFNIYNDIVYFRTANYFVVDRIKYDGQQITYANAYNSYFTISASKPTVNISNPFFFERGEYSVFCVLSTLSADYNESVVLPSVYKIDYNTANITKIQFDSLNINDFKNVLPIKISKIARPVLTFNSRNDIYAIVATLYDQNNLPYIYQIVFAYDERRAYIRGVKLVVLETTGKFKTINWKTTQNMNEFTINAILTGSNIAVNTTEGCVTLW